MAEKGGSDDGANVVEDGKAEEQLHAQNFPVRDPRNGLEKIRIEILSAVGKTAHDGHDEQQVGKDAEMVEESSEDFLKRGRMALLPGFRFGREQSEDDDERRYTQTDDEHGAPAEDRRNELHGDGGHEISERIAALHDAGEDTAQPARRTLHGVGGSDSPISAHANAVQAAHDEEEGVRRRESAKNGDRREKKHAKEQRALSAEAISEWAEKERPDGTHGESERKRVDDGRLAHVEARGQRVEKKDDNKEVEGIENPAEDSRTHGELPAGRFLIGELRVGG